MRMKAVRPASTMQSTSMGAYRGNVTGVRPISALRASAPSVADCFGMTNRPSTPMKAVIGNYYGEVGAFHHKQRESQILDLDN